MEVYYKKKNYENVNSQDQWPLNFFEGVRINKICICLYLLIDYVHEVLKHILKIVININRSFNIFHTIPK